MRKNKENKITGATDQEITIKLEEWVALEKKEQVARKKEQDAYSEKVDILDSMLDIFIDLSKMAKANFAGMETQGRLIRVSSGDIYKVIVGDGWEHGLNIERMDIYETSFVVEGENQNEDKTV